MQASPEAWLNSYLQLSHGGSCHQPGTWSLRYHNDSSGCIFFLCQSHLRVHKELYCWRPQRHLRCVSLVQCVCPRRSQLLKRLKAWPLGGLCWTELGPCRTYSWMDDYPMALLGGWQAYFTSQRWPCGAKPASQAVFGAQVLSEPVECLSLMVVNSS